MIIHRWNIKHNTGALLSITGNADKILDFWKSKKKIMGYLTLLLRTLSIRSLNKISEFSEFCYFVITTLAPPTLNHWSAGQMWTPLLSWKVVYVADINMTSAACQSSWIELFLFE